MRAIALLLTATSASAAEIRLTVENVRSTSGKLGIQVLSADAYAGKGAATLSLLVAPVSPKTQVVLPNLPPGRYAVRVMHDRNGNGKLDTNFLGIPNEPFAFSNEASASLGPPAFDAAAFELRDGALSLKITLK